MTGRFDVVIAGAGIAGCTAARLFALKGASVALVEKKSDPTSHKVACTHHILSSAVPTIDRMGLAPLLAEAGAARTNESIWTTAGGWLKLPADATKGYGITRRRLDPMLRSFAAETEGVEYFGGSSVVELLEERGRTAGVVIENPDRERMILQADLTVAADGRDSAIAALAGVKARVRPNGRFMYFAYWRGMDHQDTATTWMLDPDVAIRMPNEDGITGLAVAPTLDKLEHFRADPEIAYREFISRLPDGPDLEVATLDSRVMGRLDMTNRMRPAGRPGLAFAGDAAISADPVFGVGCSWAFQMADWLVDGLEPALHDPDRLDKAIERYAHAVRRRLGLHHFQISNFSSRKRLMVPEKMVFKAASKSALVGSELEAFASRRRMVP